ncbi:MAG TPA: hypothetical protein VHG51_19365 [Longimicrobiaceae bacterium]|nr:hypothetical protein [Longimicrobiaceae bacterium]
MKRTALRTRPAAAAALALLLACWAGGAAGSPRPGGAGPGGVLFIGNSLTARNDLPGMVASLAAGAGLDLPTSAVVADGTNLEDHWTAGRARGAVARGGWSVVVMQQGPSTAPESREHLLRWSAVVAGAARDAGARPALYMVWPPPGGDWDRASGSYRLAAEHVDGELLPVGDAIRAALRRDPSLQLLDHDGFHPTPLGTYLAAVVVVARLGGRSPVGLPRRAGGRISVPVGTARLLQEAAAEAIAGRHKVGQP